MLEEIILQLPLGFLCTDLAGKLLFMNASAQELLELNSPAGARQDHPNTARLPKLPPEITRGIAYFRELLDLDRKTFSKPFPKLYFQNQGSYEIAFLLYAPSEELSRDSQKEARIIVLLEGARSMTPTSSLAKRFSLTVREKEVLRYLMEGKQRKEIAAVMNLSEETVRSYFRNLYQKLHVTNRVEAATLGLRMELMESLKSVLQMLE